MTHHDKPQEAGKKEGTKPLQAEYADTMTESGEAKVEPIKPGDQRVTRKSSLLGTCYPTSSGQPKTKEE
jgi:hypothetical protein